jgi:hypothetical protein
MVGDKKKRKKNPDIVGMADKTPTGTVCRVWK